MSKASLICFFLILHNYSMTLLIGIYRGGHVCLKGGTLLGALYILKYEPGTRPSGISVPMGEIGVLYATVW
jgi:hypothetical protein